MTQDVLEGSRSKTYVEQRELVAGHASRTGLPYELPGALAVETAILSHYVRSGEHVCIDDPRTYTRSLLVVCPPVGPVSYRTTSVTKTATVWLVSVSSST